MSTPIKILKQVLTKYGSPITLNYPSSVVAERKYSQIPKSLRGIPMREKEKCTGCKACSFICSGRATTATDASDKRIVDVFLFRCTFCAHCQEACPEEAITLTEKFEVSVFSQDDPNAHIQTELELLRCKGCGIPFATKKMLERTYERLMDKIDPFIEDSVSVDYKKLSEYCSDCRRANSIHFDTHTKKYVWLEVV
ncbi:MAG: 4Fe-4S dicluster domain-containing protein [Candidatus Methanomethylicaceae archaeon]